MQYILDTVRGAADYVLQTRDTLNRTLMLDSEALNEDLKLDKRLRESLREGAFLRLFQNVSFLDHLLRHQAADFRANLEQRVNDIEGARLTFAVLARELAGGVVVADDHDLPTSADLLNLVDVERYELGGATRRIANDIVQDSFIEEVDDKRLKSMLLGVLLTRLYTHGYTPNISPILGVCMTRDNATELLVLHERDAPTLREFLFERDSVLRRRLGLPTLAECEAEKENDLFFTLGPHPAAEAAPSAVALHQFLTNVVHQYATTLAVVQEHCNFTWLSEEPLDDLEIIDLHTTAVPKYAQYTRRELIPEKYFLVYGEAPGEYERLEGNNTLVTQVALDLRGKQGFAVDAEGRAFPLDPYQALPRLDGRAQAALAPRGQASLIEYRRFSFAQGYYFGEGNAVMRGEAGEVVVEPDPLHSLILDEPASVASGDAEFVLYYHEAVAGFDTAVVEEFGRDQVVTRVYRETRRRVDYDAGRLVRHVPFRYKLGGEMVEVPNLGFLVKLRRFNGATAFFDFSQFLVVEESERAGALKVHFAPLSDPWYPYGKTDESTSAQIVVENIYDMIPGEYGEYKRFVANFQNLYNPAIDLAILCNTLVREKRLMAYKQAVVRAYQDAESQAHLRKYGDLTRFRARVVDDVLPVELIKIGLKILPKVSGLMVRQSSKLARMVARKAGDSRAAARKIMNEVAKEIEHLSGVSVLSQKQLGEILAQTVGEVSEGQVVELLNELLIHIEPPEDYVHSQNFPYIKTTLLIARDMLRSPLFRWDEAAGQYDAFNGSLADAEACDAYRPSVTSLLAIRRPLRGRDYADLTILGPETIGTERLVAAVAENGPALKNFYDTARLVTSSEAMVGVLSSLTTESDAFIARGSQGFIHRITIEVPRPADGEANAEFRAEAGRCESARARAEGQPLADVSAEVETQMLTVKTELERATRAERGLPSGARSAQEVNELADGILAEMYGKTRREVVEAQLARPDEAQIREIVDAFRRHLEDEKGGGGAARAGEEAEQPVVRGGFGAPRGAQERQGAPARMKVHAALKSFKTGLPPGNPADYITVTENNISSPELVNETMVSAVVSTLYEKGISPNFMLTYSVFLAKYTPRSLINDIYQVSTATVDQFFVNILGADPTLRNLLNIFTGAAGGGVGEGVFNPAADSDLPLTVRQALESQENAAWGVQCYRQLRRLTTAFVTRVLNESMLRAKVDGLIAVLQEYVTRGLFRSERLAREQVQLVVQRLGRALPVDNEKEVLDSMFYIAMALNIVAAIDPDAANLVFLDLQELTAISPVDYLTLYHTLASSEAVDDTFRRWVRGELSLSGRVTYAEHVRAVAALVHTPEVGAVTKNEVYLIQELIDGSFSKFRRFCAKLQAAMLREGKEVPTFDQYVTNALQQVIYSLQIFQDHFNGVHGDLHPDNIFIKYCDETLYRGVPLCAHEEFEYALRGRRRAVKNMGFIVKLGDMGHSSINIGVTGQPYVRYDAETRQLVVDEMRNRKQIHKEVVLGARETALRLVNEQFARLLDQLQPSLVTENLDTIEKVITFFHEDQFGLGLGPMVNEYIGKGVTQAINDFTGTEFISRDLNDYVLGPAGLQLSHLAQATQLLRYLPKKYLVWLVETFYAQGMNALNNVNLYRLLRNLASQLQLITKLRSVNRFLPAFDMSNCFQNLAYDAEFYQTPMVSLFSGLEVALEQVAFDGVLKNFERSLPNMYPVVVTSTINLVQFNNYLSRGFTFLTTPELMVGALHAPRRVHDRETIRATMQRREPFALGRRCAGCSGKNPAGREESIYVENATQRVYCSERCLHGALRAQKGKK